MLVGWLRGNPDAQRFLAANIDGVATTTLTAAELFDGAASSNREAYGIEVERLLAAIPLIPFGPRHARAFGPIRALRRKAGLPGGPIDLLVAAVCQAEAAVIVTRNKKDFDGIPGLNVETW